MVNGLTPEHILKIIKISSNLRSTKPSPRHTIHPSIHPPIHPPFNSISYPCTTQIQPTQSIYPNPAYPLHPSNLPDSPIWPNQYSTSHPSWAQSTWSLHHCAIDLSGTETLMALHSSGWSGTFSKWCYFSHSDSSSTNELFPISLIIPKLYFDSFLDALAPGTFKVFQSRTDYVRHAS